MRGTVWILAVVLAGCDAGDGGGDTESSTGTAGAAATTGGQPAAESSSGGDTSGTDTTALPDPTTGPIPGSTTAPDPTMDPSGDEESSSGGEPLPEGPGCSVQVTTHGALTDPLPRGDEAFPPVIADALEDWCGCHTLESNNQNVEHEGLQPPGGTLFLDYADMSRPSGGGTLAQALSQAIDDYSMPPGSCSFPADAQTLLEEWFAQGAPSGADYQPM